MSRMLWTLDSGFEHIEVDESNLTEGISLHLFYVCEERKKHLKRKLNYSENDLNLNLRYIHLLSETRF